MDVIDRLHEAIRASRIPKKTIAHRAGLSPSELSRLLNHHLEAPSIHDIEAIAAAINLPMATLYQDGPVPEVDLRRTREALRTLTEFVDRHDPGMRAPVPPVPAAREKPEPSRVAIPFAAAATPNAVLFDEQDLVRLKIPDEIWNKGAHHAARVIGDSMVGAGIHDGDVVFFRRTRNVRAARNKIVVCRVNESVYVKRLVFDGEDMQLLSESDHHRPLTVRENDDRELYGIVVDWISPAKR